MKKSFLFVLIGVLLVFSLAACGEPASNDEVSQNGDVQQSQSVNPEDVEPQEPEVKLETAEDYANALKDAGCPIGEIVVYTEETDPNEYLADLINTLVKSILAILLWNNLLKVIWQEGQLKFLLQPKIVQADMNILRDSMILNLAHLD